MWRSRGLCALPSFCRQTNLKEVERWVTAGDSPQGNTCGTISSFPPFHRPRRGRTTNLKSQLSQISIISNHNYQFSILNLLILNFHCAHNQLAISKKQRFLTGLRPKIPLKGTRYLAVPKLSATFAASRPRHRNRETTREHKPPSPPPRQGRARCRKEERSYALFR